MNVFKSETDKRLGRFRCISFSLERRTDAVFDLAEMIVSVNEEICDLADTFAGFLFDDSPSVIVAVLVSGDKHVFIALPCNSDGVM